jgi:2-polyprenyl-3-methyl-5-hydroxy-6-metoxy-1,4-benzoquinol methylase
MPKSYEFGKDRISSYLKSKYPKDAKILDVGAGEGTYYNYLSDYFENIDAVEIFKKNIDDYDLKNKYKNVYNENIVDFKYDKYDIIIFGDIIEHLSIEDAQKVLNYASVRCKEIVVAVPYEYKQDEINGNIHERHIQDDLTIEKMEMRYPYLELFFGNDEYGYYLKKKSKDEPI